MLDKDTQEEETTQEQEQKHTPQWAIDYIVVLLDILNLQDWQVTVHPCETLDVPGSRKAEGMELSGTCAVDPRYLAATIELEPDIQPDKQGYATLTHEVLHIALAQTNWLGDGLIEEFVPKGVQHFIGEVWRDAHEQDIERLARAISPLLRAQLVAGDNKDGE